MINRCSGSVSNSMIVVELSTETFSTPLIVSCFGRVPVSIKINGAVISRVSPSERETSSVFGALKWASPLSRSRSSPCTAVIRLSKLLRAPSTIPCLRLRTACRSTEMGPVCTPCQIGDARAGDHRFGGSTADVNTDTTELAALDQRHFPACLRVGDWEESTALTGPDHNHIIICGL